METNLFLQQLQSQAHKQAKLSQSRILPKQLDTITSFIGEHAWQVLTVTSFMTALVLKLTQPY